MRYPEISKLIQERSEPLLDALNSSEHLNTAKIFIKSSQNLLRRLFSKNRDDLEVAVKNYSLYKNKLISLNNPEVDERIATIDYILDQVRDKIEALLSNLQKEGANLQNDIGGLLNRGEALDNAKDQSSVSNNAEHLTPEQLNHKYEDTKPDAKVKGFGNLGTGIQTVLTDNDTHPRSSVPKSDDVKPKIRHTQNPHGTFKAVKPEDKESRQSFESRRARFWEEIKAARKI